jgi:hypothetical protein
MPDAPVHHHFWAGLSRQIVTERKSSRYKNIYNLPSYPVRFSRNPRGLNYFLGLAIRRQESGGKDECGIDI